MALPALGAAAKFIMANGTRAATMKFGKAAVDKAKDQIKKRESAVMEKADKANIGVKKTPSPQSIRRGQDTQRDKRVAKEEAKRTRKPFEEEVPLKFRKGGRSAVASAGKRKRPVFGGQDSDAVIKFDSRNPVTARKEEAAKKTAAKKAAQAKTDAAVAKRTAKQKAERDAMMAKVKKDRPMPKRPSAISLANAADPKAKRPAKPQKAPTTSKVAAPKAKTKKDPRFRFGEDYGPEKALRRNTITKEGKTLANVTKEQLRDSGMTLRQYLNFMDREGKRPPKKAMRGGMMKSKMKAKGMKAGGKMKAKGMKAGGKVKAKGMNMGGRVSRGRGSTTTPLGNQRAQRAMGTRFEKMGGFSGAMDRARQSMFKALKGKGMKEGGKLPMVEKDGKMVPFFAADGKGKMMGGGMVPKTKGYFKGGKTMESGAIGRGDYKGSLVGEFHAGNLPRSRVGRALRISGQKNAPPTRTYSPKTKRTGTAPRSRRSPR